MKHLMGIVLFLSPKKISWDRLAGEITAVVFVIIICWYFNHYPNAYFYSKVGTGEAVTMMVNGFILGQICRLRQ